VANRGEGPTQRDAYARRIATGDIEFLVLMAKLADTVDANIKQP
jgi:hypothetical protein